MIYCLWELNPRGNINIIHCTTTSDFWDVTEYIYPSTFCIHSILMQLYTFTPLYLCRKYYKFYWFCRYYTDDTDNSWKMALKCSRRLTSSGCLSIIPVIHWYRPRAVKVQVTCWRTSSQFPMSSRITTHMSHK